MVKTETMFDPAVALQRVVSFDNIWDPEIQDMAKRILYEDMKTLVPEEFRHRIQYKCSMPMGFGVDRDMSWHYIPVGQRMVVADDGLVNI